MMKDPGVNPKLHPANIEIEWDRPTAWLKQQETGDKNTTA